MRQFYVYIMASKSRVVYTGITNNLQRRVWEHKHNELPGFTSQYRVHRLVYYETFKYVGNAIAREKRIKGWIRSRKITLVESLNPTWEDLSEHWGERIELFNPECLPEAAEKQVLRFAQDDKQSSDAKINQK